MYYLLSIRSGNVCCAIEPAAALRPLAEVIFGRSHPIPRSASLLIQWLPEASRADRLSIKMSGGESHDRKKSKEHFLTELAAQQAATLRTARTTAGQFTAVINLPIVDEASVGQLIELHALAAAVKHFFHADIIHHGMWQFLSFFAGFKYHHVY